MAFAAKAVMVGGVELVDVRGMFPSSEPAARVRNMSRVLGVAVHHDGVIMPAGDRDYSGSTLNEDLARLAAIYHHGKDQGWGGMPYHLVASPSGRTFYCLSLNKYGAHVARRNHELVGLSLMGNFTYAQPGDLQLCAAGRGLLAIWRELASLLPYKGHREWALPAFPTSCPGDTWWTWQNRLLVMTVALGRVLFP